MSSNNNNNNSVNSSTAASSGIDNPSFESDLLASHKDSRQWMLAEFTRRDANTILANKADGTFLIRRSADTSAPFALSIVLKGVVGHCLIKRSERGYGFTEPYLIFPTLKDLVMHYATTSLEEHNHELITTLAHPVYAPQPENAYVLNN